ncbi:O-antigen polymerase [Flagellimonas oceanensis]|uniref:O-antigen polymerase n=1 Tax=Flagellimonas oceanensis TaxID=2499163 RepID=UPI000F8C37A6|nr:O-antigen polymerase [Allomuricauda oceanensis]
MVLLTAVILLYMVNRFFDIKNLLNPFVFFYLYQTVFCFIALSYYERYPVEISEELKRLLFSAYILTFVGAMFSRYLFQKAGIRYVKYNEIGIGSKPSRAFLNSGLLILILGFLIFAYFTYRTGGLIIFGDEIENARIEKRKGAGMVNVLFISFMLYGFLVLLLDNRISKGIKAVSFIFVAFALLSFGSRAPLIKLIVAMFLLIGVLSSKKFTIGKYFQIGLFSILIVVVLGALRTNLKGDVGFIDLVLSRAGWRPFVNIQNLQRIFDFFPEQHPFLYGETYIYDLKILLPGHNPNFGTQLKEIMNWEFDGGSITPTFLGIGYINFGKSAFFLYPLMYGFFFNSIYQLFFYKPVSNNFKVVFLILFSIGIAGSLSTGLLPALIANTVFLLFCVVVHIVFKQLFMKKPFRLKFD